MERPTTRSVQGRQFCAGPRTCPSTLARSSGTVGLIGRAVVSVVARPSRAMASGRAQDATGRSGAPESIE
eukprot:11154541-Lingulodinium_polyedra.AAC.1